MLKYLIRRVLLLVPTLLTVYTIVFLLMHATPGGPWDIERNVPPEVVANLNRRFGLDQPLHVQYVTYLWRALTELDLGISYSQQSRTVSEIIGDFFPVSLQLGLAAMLLATLVGLTLGIVSALHQDTWLDYAAMFVAIVGVSVPNFVTAPVMILVFALGLKLVPTSGWSGIFSPQAIIPVVALALPAAAAIARYTRSSLLEVIRRDYIRTARAKGLAEGSIVLRHALKNALIPVATVASVYLAFAITGSFFVETATGVPGIGRYFVNSVTARDYPVIMGTVLLFAAVIAVLNLVADLTYGLLDPRIRYE